METVRLTLKRREIPLELEGVDGVVANYTLREFDGNVRDAYLTKNIGRLGKAADGSMTQLKSYDGIYSGLIAKCLFDEVGNPIDEKVIQTWPSGTQKTLFEMAFKLNGLDQKAGDDAKND